jgi:TonB family protein
LRSRPPILTERGFDRRLAAMVVVALGLHFAIVLVLFFVANLKLRPDAPIDSYTVEVVDGGELGGHLPSGLPDVKIGPAAGPSRPPRIAKAAPEPPRPPEPEAAPKAEEAKPPEPAVKQEPPPPAPPKAPEPPRPEPPAQLAREEPRPDVVIPDKTAPTPPAVAPSAPPPPPPSPAPTRAANPTPGPTAHPAPSRPPATPRPAPSPRPSPAPEKPKVTPAPRKSEMAVARREGEAAKPTVQPPARGKPTPAPTPPSRDARIAEALARVQQRVGGERGADQRAADRESGTVASARGPAPGGGVGGPDAPDANRRVGIGPGAGGAGKVRGVEFLLYYNQMLSRIRSAWVWTGGGAELEVKVRFRILDDGRVVDVRITQASSDNSYDASVLRAIRGVSPLDPPPAQYRGDFSDVELTFHPSDLKTAG